MHEYLALLKVRAKRMETLVEGILGYSLSRDSRSEPALVDTQAIVDDLLLHDFEAIPVTFQIARDLPQVQGESTALRQLFSNLLSNAVEHGCTSGGVVRVSSREEQDSYHFEVSDNGPGIAMEDQTRIFEAFQSRTARPAAHHSGLGLSIAMGIVLHAGGELGVESQLGSGATFWFDWPKPTNQSSQLP